MRRLIGITGNMNQQGNDIVILISYLIVHISGDKLLVRIGIKSILYQPVQVVINTPLRIRALSKHNRISDIQIISFHGSLPGIS